MGFFEIGFHTICPGWLQTAILLDLCLLSSWDYRREPGIRLLRVLMSRQWLRYNVNPQYWVPGKHTYSGKEILNLLIFL
jgi:hypothetical protein